MSSLCDVISNHPQKLMLLKGELLKVIVDELGNVGSVKSRKDCRMLHCKTLVHFPVKSKSLVQTFQGHEI